MEATLEKAEKKEDAKLVQFTKEFIIPSLNNQTQLEQVMQLVRQNSKAGDELNKVLQTELTKDQLQKIEAIPQIIATKPKSQPPVATPQVSVNAAKVQNTNIFNPISIT